jgi:hypothetical protein
MKDSLQHIAECWLWLFLDVPGVIFVAKLPDGREIGLLDFGSLVAEPAATPVVPGNKKSSNDSKTGRPINPLSRYASSYVLKPRPLHLTKSLLVCKSQASN